MKRQRGRGRGKPGGGNQGNRSFESNGPEVKIRGNAATIYEKYMQLARDATSSGDRVRAENLQQHAEHYFRILQATQPQRRDNSNDDDSDDNSSDRDNDARGDNRNDNRGRNRHDGNRNDNRGRNRNESVRDDDNEGDNTLETSGRGRKRNGDETADEQERPQRRQRRQSRPERDPLEVVNPEGEQPDTAQPTEMGEDQPKPKARRGRKPKSADDGAAQKALDDASDAADSKPGEAA
ncbi:DUF4167 domain-containing protein [Hyphobacterium marinum]|uniref:DUF4167 domain-containing protein n=1 Tax=Hyphobacterium marinum TaxID=3116574 RepID=A0ABU7LXG6_9PROT|nr:DUF4167 domain-containing protein [Hyphobacterium sp. Y6023]MEE2566225.1 DUF4167 domain-containing protein [Hyphobacterium sp. Y6023]